MVAIDLITEHIRGKLQQHDLRRIFHNLEVIPSNFQTRGMHTIVRDSTTSTPDFVFYADRLLRLVRAHDEMVKFRGSAPEARDEAPRPRYPWAASVPNNVLRRRVADAAHVATAAASCIGLRDCEYSLMIFVCLQATVESCVQAGFREHGIKKKKKRVPVITSVKASHVSMKHFLNFLRGC